MSLPKNYLDLMSSEQMKGSDKAPGTSAFDYFNTGYTSPYIDMPAEDAGNSLWDFLEFAGKGAASGITWGLSEGAGEKDYWEDMSGVQRAGWILGEGGSYFIPYVGPFGAIGKGLRTAPKLFKANKYIDDAAEQALKAIDKLAADP